MLKIKKYIIKNNIDKIFIIYSLENTSYKLCRKKSINTMLIVEIYLKT